MINQGERPQLIYFTLVFFLLGAGLAIGRSTTDALFYKKYGIEYLPVMYLLLSLSLMFTSTIYAAVSDMLPAERFFSIITRVLITLLIGNWALMSFTASQAVFPLYFLVYEIASEILLVHSMLYLSQNLDIGQVKRLSPLILAGMQLGVISGGLLLATSSQAIGVQNMLLIWSGLLFAAIAAIRIYHNRNGVSPLYQPGKRTQHRLRHAIAQIAQGARFTRQSKLLLNLSFAGFFMVIAFYVLCYSVGRIYTETFADEAALSAFFGTLTVTCGSLALLLQLFVTNRIIRSLGTKRANLIFPLAIGSAYAALLASFTIPLAIFASILKDTLMPAVRNPVRNVLFNAVPAYMQGRSRAMALVVVLPLALAATGTLLLIAQHSGEPQNFLMIGALSALGYLYFSIRSNRSYLDSMIATLREKVFLPAQEVSESFRAEDASVFDELVKGIQHENESVFSAYARAMLKLTPDQAATPVLERLATVSMQTTEQLLPQLLTVRPQGLREVLNEKLQQCSTPCPWPLLTALVELGEDSTRLKQEIDNAIRSDSPRQRAAGIYGRLLRGTDQEITTAWKLWRTMLFSATDREIICALDVFQRLPTPMVKHGLRQFTRLPGVQNRHDADNNLTDRPLPMLRNLCEHSNPQVRLRGLKTLPLLSVDEYREIIENALEDDHPDVRATAAEFRFGATRETHLEACQWIIDSRVSPRAQESILRCIIDKCHSQPLLQSIVRTKSREARRLLVAERQLSRKGTTELELVCLILKERQEQLIRLALLALEQLEPSVTVATIRAGLLSGDRSHRAHAAEALRQISNRELGTLLGNLIDPREATPAKLPLDTIRSTLHGCIERADPWLQSASLHALHRLPHHV
jgi:HEAT repeat protein